MQLIRYPQQLRYAPDAAVRCFCNNIITGKSENLISATPTYPASSRSLPS